MLISYSHRNGVLALQVYYEPVFEKCAGVRAMAAKHGWPGIMAFDYHPIVYPLVRLKSARSASR